ncbi:MAG: aminotransferase class V-fold PLP-dependent enzyme [Bdellovibrionota bacterium]
MKLPVFLDHHSTTPVDPRVLEAMLPFFTEKFGNAASRTHAFGWQAEEAVETARLQVASLIKAHPQEIVFTSGATEANNLALLGAARERKTGHIIASQVEHSSVLETCGYLETQGFRVTYLSVDTLGRINLEELEGAIGKDTFMISVLSANNEIGTRQPVSEIGKIAKKHGIYFHTDAAQSVGLIEHDVNAEGIDLLSLSAHKIYGPKGVGALYVRRRSPRVSLEPQTHGGRHERGIRSGTLNVPGIIGLGEAAQLCLESRRVESARIGELRDELQARVLAGLTQVQVNGDLSNRLPNNLSLSFAFLESGSILSAMRDIAASSGSACASAQAEPSHVLKAIKLSEPFARGTIRLGLGRFTTLEEVELTAHCIQEAVQKLREESQTWKFAQTDLRSNL